MIEKSTIEIVARAFFDYPSRMFHLRELARMTKLSLPSIIMATDKLAKEKIITKTKGMVLTTVAANRESTSFVWRKRLYNLELIYTSGIVEYLTKKYNYPQAIILFGSFSRGEDTEKSDVDIAVLGRNEQSLALGKFEKVLKKHVSLNHVNLEKISPEFKANLANGIVLEGSW